MGRAPRNDVPGAIVHVFARGNNRRNIFEDDEDRLRYLSLLGGEVVERRWRCLGYCLMTNHVHLVIETPEGGLGRGMCRAHGLYARSFNVRHGRTNHLFGARYGSTAIADAEHLLYASAYVAMNPVRARLCVSPGQWAWSSHRALTRAADGPSWLDTERLVELLSGAAHRPVEAYEEVIRFMALRAKVAELDALLTASAA